MQIKLKYGTGVTMVAPINPAIAAGQLLFDTADKSIYFDVSASQRIKLYDALDTAVTSIAAIEAKLAGLTEATVVAEIDAKIAELKKLVVTEKEDSSSVTLTIADNADGSAKKIKAEVKLSAEAGNMAELKNDGVYVPTPAAADTYTIKKAATADGDFAATYQLYKVAPDASETAVGDKINIAKDFLVKSADIKEVATADNPYTGAVVGDKYIDFVINTKDGTGTAEHLYLPVNELVDVYTSGSATGDMVYVTVDASTNKITATITNGTVTKAKLETAVQTSLGLADTAVQPTELSVTKEDNKYIAGITVAANGDITFDKETLPSLDAIEWGTF